MSRTAWQGIVQRNDDVPLFLYMRRLKDGEEMPIDFWNYKVNPILGYYLPKEEDQSEAMEKKYNIIAKSI